MKVNDKWEKMFPHKIWNVFKASKIFLFLSSPYSLPQDTDLPGLHQKVPGFLFPGYFWSWMP